MRTRSIAIGLLLVMLASRSGRAGELDLAVGAGASTSTWEGDGGGGSRLELSYFFRRLPWLAPMFVGKVEYSTIDDRISTYFSLGAQARRELGPVLGVARAGIVHAHEESMAAVLAAPFEALFGVGDGIRHRAGCNAGVGLQVPFGHHRRGDFYGAVDVGATWFFDDRGPSWYLSGGVAIGVRFGGAATHAR